MAEPPIFGKLASGTQPNYLHPEYRSSVKRAPTRPLIVLPHTLSERTGPVFGQDTVRERDHDLTAQHAGEPLGERIAISGRLLNEGGKPVRGALIEVWQANAAGRYKHKMDQHHRGALQVYFDQARGISLGKSCKRMAAGAHSFFDFRRWVVEPSGDTDVFSG